MKHPIKLIAATIFSMSLFSAVNADEVTKIDAQKKEYDATLSELILKSKNSPDLEVRGLGTKLCKIKCEAIKTSEYAACGPGESSNVKDCRDGAERHRVSCRNSC